jgi:lysyl-tRNA synthetase class 2
MDLTEKIFKISAQSLNKEIYKFRGFEIDLSKPFARKSMVEIIKESCGVDFETINTDEEAIAMAEKHHIDLLPHQKIRGHIIMAFFEKYGEETCIQPTFVHTYPVETSPLTKKNLKDPRYVDRFELFIGQKEFGNAYSELNDPIDQLDRFLEQQEEANKSKGENGYEG